MFDAVPNLFAVFKLATVFCILLAERLQENARTLVPRLLPGDQMVAISEKCRFLD